MTDQLAAKPPTKFAWPIYADATLAGLSVLIPIIGLDWVFETIFRRRMPGAIAKYRQLPLADFAKDTLNQSDKGCWATCLTLPLVLTIGLLKRLSRKLLYFLTVNEAADNVSYYWHRAFLVDYMLLAHHLDTPELAQIARRAMDEVLETTITSPLHQLAEQVVRHTRHILRTLWRARKGKEDEMLQQKKSIMLEHWRDFDIYLKELAAQYEQTYQKLSLQLGQEKQAD